MPKVSIIIPFNNVESYIGECLDSVINQTLTDIEIILINDASTDSGLEIVQEFIKKDKRIKLIELEERSGQGFARNRGIEAALGDYIGFVDSDDFIKPDMFETLYNAAVKSDTDITMCQAVEYDDVSQQYISSEYYSLAPLYAFKDNVFSAKDTKEVILDINVALWNKIYKRSYLETIGEKFPEGFIYEDLPFFFGTYLSAEKIQIIWRELYVYRINRKNSTMQQFNNKILDRPYMVSLTYEKMKKADYLDDITKKIQGWIINDLFHRYALLRENWQKEFFFLMKKVFKSLGIENPDDTFWRSVYHFQGYLLVMNNNFEDFNQKVFNEYLDIHQVEDRLRSEMLRRDEVDNKISNIYLDIEKNYKYTEKIVFEAKSELKSNVESVGSIAEKNHQQILTDLSEKIENQTQEVTSLTDAKIDSKTREIMSVTDEKIEKKSYKIGYETDEKISKVYDEISKNYDYTNKLAKDNSAQTSELNLKTNELVIKTNELNIKTDESIVKADKLFLQTEKLQINVDKLNSKIEEFSEKSDKLLSKTAEIQIRTEELGLKDKELIDTTKQLLSQNDKLKNKTDELSLKAGETLDKTEKLFSLTDTLNVEVQNLKNELSLKEENSGKRTHELDIKLNTLKVQSDEIIMENTKFKAQTDEKLHKVYEDTNSLIKDNFSVLYGNIKDLSYVVYDNNVVLKDSILKISENMEDNTKKNKKETESLIKELNDKTMLLVENRRKEGKKSLDEAVCEIEKKFENITLSFEAAYSELNKSFSEKENRYLLLLEEQNKKHDEEIMLLKEQLLQAEHRLNEKFETPLRKLVQKYFGK